MCRARSEEAEKGKKKKRGGRAQPFCTGPGGIRGLSEADYRLASERHPLEESQRTCRSHEAKVMQTFTRDEPGNELDG